MTFRACSSPAPTPVKPQPAPAILSQESVHTTLSITHHTRKRPSTGPRTTHGPHFVVRLNLCCASFIGRTTKNFFAVRRPKRTATNLCRASYFTAHDKESLPCVLNTDARQRFFFLHSCNKRPLVFDVRRLETTANINLCRAFRSGARQRFFLNFDFCTSFYFSTIEILFCTLYFKYIHGLINLLFLKIMCYLNIIVVYVKFELQVHRVME
jgi:hypothetical protein